MKTLKKIIAVLILMSIVTSIHLSYTEGNLQNNIILRNLPKVAQTVEQTIDTLTLKNATSFISNLPVK